MGVEPDVADVFFLLAIEIRDAGGDSCCDRVVASQNERQKILPASIYRRLLATSPQVSAISCKYLARFSPDGHFFGLLHFHVADVFDGEAEFFDGGLEAGAAESGGAHVDAAAALAEVHGNADDSYFLRHAETWRTVTGDR